MISLYTVWVDGTEVVDNYVDYMTAVDVMEYYTSRGYTNVVIAKA